MSDLGCHADGKVIACRKEAGTGCPGVDGGPHYFIWVDGDERQCMDCGIGQAEALGAARVTPTREQIAEALGRAYSSSPYRDAHLRGADAVLALMQELTERES